MARVPLQTAPGVELAPGSEVQYGATGVEPMKDVVTDDIARSGKAMQQFSQVISKLDDELNDAEATELSNDYYADVTDIKNEYGSLEGVNAVGVTQTAGEDGKFLTVFEEYQNKMKERLEFYQEKASNGTAKYIFEKKASVYTRSGLSDMTAHSIKQQRNYKENGIKSSIELSKSGAKGAYQTWNNPEGDFRKFYAKGLSDITELAILNGWNIDENAIDPTDPDKKRTLGISNQYLEEVEKYNKDVLEHVIKSFDDTNEHQQGQDFLAWIKASSLDPDQNTELNKVQKKLTEKHIEHKNSCTVDATLSNNGNQNDGKFLSHIDGLLCLSSNNAHDNNIGGDVTNGNNSNEINTTNTKRTENIDALDKKRSTSKFYSLESSLNGTLIAQHQPTHLFAIQRLDVEQADSLYTKAKSSIEIDPQRFKDDLEYATEINGKILDNYNELILEASEAKYGNKDVARLTKKIAELKSQTGGGKGTKTSRKNKIIKLEAELETATSNDSGYVGKIANDLEVIKNGIDYNFNPEEPGIKVDPVTGLQPLEVLKAKLKATITDPKELATATKDLEIKYNKIKNKKELVYNGALDKAKEVAFAEEGGWKKLAANNINIDDFTEADQEILKNGPPEESNKNVVIDLERNPLEVRDNLPAYRHQISRSQYAQLENYARSLRSDDKYVEATGNSDMFDASLIRFGYTDIVSKVTDDPKAKDQYNFKFDYKQIKDAWLNRIDTEQTNKGKKLTRPEKQELLDEILADGVITKRWGLFRKSDITIPTVALEADQFKDAFVLVGSERIYVKRIPDEVRQYFIAGYEAAGIPYTEQMIANEYVLHGKKKSKKELLKFKEENNL